MPEERLGPAITPWSCWIAGHIRTEIAAGRLTLPDRDVDSTAELIARTVLTPDTVLPIDSPRDQRRLIDLYLMPIMRTLRPKPNPNP